MPLRPRQIRPAVCAAVAAIVFLVRPASEPASSSMQQPASTPTRVVLGWAGDPATSRAVTWRARGDAEPPRAEIGVAAVSGRGVSGPARIVQAASRDVALENGRVVTHCRAEFTGLKPATAYAYRVGGGSTFSEWHRFTTASAGHEPFRFLYLGDAQSGLDKKWPAVVRAAFAAAPDARFVVHAGDLISDGYDNGMWGAFIAGLGEHAAAVPGIPVPGNNDVRRERSAGAKGSVLRVSPLWNAHFAVPGNGPAGLDDLAGQSYVLDYQGVRLVALDVNAFANDEYGRSAGVPVREAIVDWLDRVLDAPPARWLIVVQHYPVYSVVKQRDYAQLRRALMPIYDRHGVDLVLQGHDHAYARTHKVFAGRLAGPAMHGTVYATSVSGPESQPITTAWKPIMAALRQGALLYQVISVEDGRLAYEARTAGGALVDAFSLARPAGVTRQEASTLSDRRTGAKPGPGQGA